MSTLPRALQAEPGQLWAGPSQMQGWRRLQPTAPAHDRVRLKVCPRRRADYRTLTWRGQGCGGAEGHPADPAHPPGPWTGDPCPGCVPRGSGPLGLSGGSWPPADQPTEGGVLSCVHAGGGRRPAEDSPPPQGECGSGTGVGPLPIPSPAQRPCPQAQRLRWQRETGCPDPASRSRPGADAADKRTPDRQPRPVPAALAPRQAGQRTPMAPGSRPLCCDPAVFVSGTRV